MANSLTQVVMENILKSSNNKTYKREYTSKQYKENNNINQREEKLLKNILNRNQTKVCLEDFADEFNCSNQEKKQHKSLKGKIKLEDLALQVKKTKL